MPVEDESDSVATRQPLQAAIPRRGAVRRMYPLRAGATPGTASSAAIHLHPLAVESSHEVSVRVSETNLVWVSQEIFPEGNITGLVFCQFDPVANLCRFSDLTPPAPIYFIPKHYAPSRPDISGTRLVWHTVPTSTGDIISCKMNLTTGECPEQKITTNSQKQINAKVDGDFIVWEDYRNEQSDIYGRKVDAAGTLGPEKKLSQSSNNEFEPQISGNRVIWRVENASRESSLLWCERDSTGACGVRRLISGTSLYSPDISGDLIVWEAWTRAADNSESWDLWFCIIDGAGQCLPNALIVPGSHESFPQVDGDRLVFERNLDRNTDILSCTLDRNTKNCVSMQALTNHPGLQVRPVVAGNLIIFQDHRNSQGDLYYYSPNSSPATEVIGSSPPQGSIDARNDLSFNGGEREGLKKIELYLRGNGGVTATDFRISEVGDRDGRAPTITSLSPSQYESTVVLNLSESIQANAWTHIEHLPTGTTTYFNYLSGDINQDRVVNEGEVSDLVSILSRNRATFFPISNLDLNRSQLVTGADIITLIDLMNHTPQLNLHLPEYNFSCLGDPPPAVSAGPDRNATPGQAVNFVGSASDPDQQWLTYHWDFGHNRAYETSQTASYVYPSAGSYTATFTATDSCGTSASDTALVNVSSAPPTVIRVEECGPEQDPCVVLEVVSPQPFRVGTPINFDGTKSCSVRAGITCPSEEAREGNAAGLRSYVWTISGQGIFGRAATAAKTFTTAGRYRISLAVSDGAGTHGVAMNIDVVN